MTVAVDAMRSASNPHAFMGVTEQGLAAIVKTRGNKVRSLPDTFPAAMLTEAYLLLVAGCPCYPPRRHVRPQLQRRVRQGRRVCD